MLYLLELIVPCPMLYVAIILINYLIFNVIVFSKSKLCPSKLLYIFFLHYIKIKGTLCNVIIIVVVIDIIGLRC